MFKKKDIYFILLLLIIIIIFIILNKKNEEKFYSEQPCPSPGPCPESSEEEEVEEKDVKEEDKEEDKEEEDKEENLLDKIKQIQITNNNETEKIFKEKLSNQLFVNTMVNTLKEVLDNKLKDKDLNEIIKLEIKDSSFVIKISSINGTEILNNSTLKNKIIDKMIELFAKFIPKINNYEVVIGSGSLIITLKKKEETEISTCEPTEHQELEAFMKMFNNSDENIIQYEPDGVSGIFAPYIKLN